VPRAENGEAVNAIERWVALACVQPGDALLRRVTKGGLIGGRLHPQSVSNIIKARVAEYHMRRGVPAEAAKAEAQRFSGHSLRVGFSVAAAEAGGRHPRHCISDAAQVDGDAGALRAKGRAGADLAASAEGRGLSR
jgi:hypothetical protein